eukprot:6180327-Pleurochrysis_carterae.AAC.2
MDSPRPAALFQSVEMRSSRRAARVGLPLSARARARRCETRPASLVVVSAVCEARQHDARHARNWALTGRPALSQCKACAGVHVRARPRPCACA